MKGLNVLEKSSLHQYSETNGALWETSSQNAVQPKQASYEVIGKHKNSNSCLHFLSDNIVHVPEYYKPTLPGSTLVSKLFSCKV